jgi:ATP-dependent helicase/nuclease subunit A
MSAVRPIPPDTRERQRRAADPAHSAWVSANAGSGKTHVLAQRVVRLLLEGVPPAKILCLTFTKAAAANMSMRVFDTLSKWTRLNDADLAAAIAAMGADSAQGKRLAFARRLFARTVETPGGLKIQTIHAFCEKLLHLFPFEANVAARFEVIEDVRRAELLERARSAVIARAVQGEIGTLGASLRMLAGETSQSGFDKIITEALRQRTLLREALLVGDNGLDGYRQALARRLGLGAHETCATLERAMVEDGLASSRWGEIAHRLGADASEKDSCANRLERAARTSETSAKREAYLSVFLTQGREPRADSYLPQSLRKAHPDLCAALDQERHRLCDLVVKHKGAQTVERTVALVTLAQAILADYAQAKSLRGLLDFDDLIERTLILLTRSDATWVLYKLDAGIDHILVDEAQDTSPQQWEILRHIAEDFTAGQGQHDRIRTFFAVGDEKQSIYSFQGAAPHMFDKMRREFQVRVEAAEQTFAHVPLNMSFRSAPGILQMVDEVFSIEENFRGLSADNVKTVHTAWKTDLPALVELWEPIVAEERDDPRDWRLPLDLVSEQEPPVVLARRIAATIAGWLAPNSLERVHDENRGGMRRIRAGDVMILVRKRGPFFEAMIRALKEMHVAVAGADRLALTEHIAVMDLIAAGRAILLPQDDLTLACVLKSPLVGLDDDDLITLAPQRTASLAAALAASGDERHRRAAEKLAIWRRWAAALTPFFFYMRLTGAGGGRRDLVARLGPEAADAIDEFLRLALAHDREGPPSLAGFLAELAAADISIKRDMETAGEAVRVMTVHAAKGLEAKIVFLPETCEAPSGMHDPKLFRLDGPTGLPLVAWTPRRAADPQAVAEARETVRRAAQEEHRRLLYVAMTRAEERLYVCGFRGRKALPNGCWYEAIQSALAEGTFTSAPAHWNGDETILRRLSQPRPLDGAPDSLESMSVDAQSLPEWLLRPAPAEQLSAPPVRPSSALAAADEIRRQEGGRRSVERSAAMISGRLVHALLQHLPSIEPQRRREVAERFVAARGRGFDAAYRHLLVERALAVIDAPDLAVLFGSRSQAEVAVASYVRRTDGSFIEIVGQIDRLAETESEIFIADYKSGAAPAVADTPLAYVVQLALYRQAVAPLYPDHEIRAFLVWTEAAEAVEIDAASLDAALARVVG